MRLAVTMIVAGVLALPASALAQGSSSSFSQLTGAEGCVSQEPACPAARAKGCAGRLHVGAARSRAYRVRAGGSRAVKARLGKRARRVVRKRGRVRVTVAARDSRRLTRPSKRRLLVRRAR